MVNTIWVAVTSLVGVVIGGTLSMSSQRIAERSASRRQGRALHCSMFPLADTHN